MEDLSNSPALCAPLTTEKTQRRGSAPSPELNYTSRVVRVPDNERYYNERVVLGRRHIAPPATNSRAEVRHPVKKILGPSPGGHRNSLLPVEAVVSLDNPRRLWANMKSELLKLRR